MRTKTAEKTGKEKTNGGQKQINETKRTCAQGAGPCEGKAAVFFSGGPVSPLKMCPGD